jgi:hypothetical protein
MNEYGAVVERYWQGKTAVLGEKLVPLPCVNEKFKVD